MSARALAAVAAVLGVLALGACSGDGEPRRTTPPATSTATRTGPLSGPALAVKIDNTAKSHPHVGMAQADVVYVEPVEGGLTRLLAVFSRHQAREVGPVRSGRETDVTLLANWGKVAFAYSGSSSYTARILARGAQVNLSNDQSGRSYRRDRSRPAPYNLIGDPKALLARAGGSVRPGDIGFRYGPPIAGGIAANSVTATWPAATVSLRWNAKRGQYLVVTDGRPDVSPSGTQYGAATVVVQYVTSKPSGNRDVNGRPTPVEQLVGSGKAVVLRGGRAWQATWSRASATSPTTFTAGGQVVTFAPQGPVWVLLEPTGRTATVR